MKNTLQGAKKVIFTDCHLGKLELASTSRPKRHFKGKGKDAHEPKAQTAGAYPGFLSIKQA